jgi:hypothetical protein
MSEHAEAAEPYSEYSTGKYQIKRDMEGYAVVVLPLAQFESLYHEMEQQAREAVAAEGAAATHPVRVDIRLDVDWNKISYSEADKQELLDFVRQLRNGAE